MFPIHNSLKKSPSAMVPGIGCICFDEFHERSIESDLAFTLCLHLKRQRQAPNLWDTSGRVGVWWVFFRLVGFVGYTEPGVWPPGWWSWAPLLDPWQSRSTPKLIADGWVNHVQTTGQSKKERQLEWNLTTVTWNRVIMLDHLYCCKTLGYGKRKRPWGTITSSTSRTLHYTLYGRIV